MPKNPSLERAAVRHTFLPNQHLTTGLETLLDDDDELLLISPRAALVTTNQLNSKRLRSRTQELTRGFRRAQEGIAISAVEMAMDQGSMMLMLEPRDPRQLRELTRPIEQIDGVMSCPSFNDGDFLVMKFEGHILRGQDELRTAMKALRRSLANDHQQKYRAVPHRVLGTRLNAR